MKNSSRSRPSVGTDLSTHGVMDCVQCGRCAAACRVSFVSGESPRKVVRYLQQGDIHGAVHSGFLMLCKQCRTCTLTCPQEVDIAEIMRNLARYRFTGHENENDE